jgi:hypothetical protein
MSCRVGDLALFVQDRLLGHIVRAMQLSDVFGDRDAFCVNPRSLVRDWAAERTNFPNHVVEMALAHSIGNAVERSYRRGDLFEKRKRLMQAWADYCSRPTTAMTVTPFRKLSDA